MNFKKDIKMLKVNYLKELDLIFCKFAQIFNQNQCDNTLMAYLKSKAVPINPTCNKKITNIYKCLDCEANNTSCICTECYENSKEQHKDHRVSFLNGNGDASCDCGDSNLWSPNGSCSKHKGPLKSDKEIQEFISSSFTIHQTKAIRDILNELVEMIHLLIQKQIITYDSPSPYLNQFLSFLNKICEANQAFVHFISDLFIKNYPCRTTHTCIKITPTSVEIFDQEKEHDCCCCFIRLLFEVFGNSKRNDPILYILLNSLKLKTVMGIAFISSFRVLFIHDCQSIFNFSIQILAPESNSIILNSPDLMKHFIAQVYFLFEYELGKNKSSELFKELLNEFFYIVIHLLKFDTYALINNHLTVYKRIIDMLNLLHNESIVIEDFQLGGFNEEMINSEYKILVLSSYLFSIFDYENNQSVNELFAYFFAIFKNKEYKQLEEREYSFHISLYRVFGIFLTHYLFSHSITKGVDLKSAFDYFMTKYDFDYEMIILDLFKALGFIISIKHNYWVYYGIEMMVYPKMFFNYNLISTIPFSLIQLLCSYPKYSHFLSIDSILKSTNVHGSYDKLKTLLVTNEDQIESADIKWTKDADNEKALLFGKDVIELIIYLQRDNNSSLLDVYFHSFQDLIGNKIFIQNLRIGKKLEQAAINSIIKRKIAHLVMSNDNYCSFSKIKKERENSMPFLNDEKELLAIIDEILDKNTSHTNQMVGFSLKPEYYNLIDLSTCINNTKQGNISRYIMDFKKNEINLLQTKEIVSSSLEKSLKDDFNSALYSPDTVKWLCLFTIAQLSNSKWGNVLRHYLYCSLKHLAIILLMNNKNVTENHYLEDCIMILKRYVNQINTLLSKPEVTVDENQLSMCRYLKQLLNQSFNDNVIIQQSSIQQESAIDTQKKANKNSEMLSKYKQQFKEKNQQFTEAMGLTKQTNNEPKIEGCQCIICRGEINTDSYYTIPFGRFGLIVKDLFIHNTKMKNIRLKFKQNKMISSIIRFDDFIGKNIKAQIRLLTCNHYIHFSCYEEFISQEESINKCPFCQQSCNVFIPFVDLNQKNEIVQGLSFERFLMNVQKKQEPIIDKSLFKLNTQSFVWQPPVNNFIEQIIFELKDKMLISDINKDEHLFEKVYLQLLDYFKGFFIFYENYTPHQISLYNTFFTSIRLTIKAGYMNVNHFLTKFKQITECFLSPKAIDLTKGQLSNKISEMLFLYIILFGNKNESTNITYILKMFIPYIFVEMSMKNQLEQQYKLSTKYDKETMSYDKLIKFIEGNEAKRLFTFYLFNISLCVQILINDGKTDIGNTNPDSNIVSKRLNDYLDNLSLSQYKDKLLFSLLLIQYPSFWLKSDDSISILKTVLGHVNLNKSIILHPSLFEIGIENKVTFVDLPSSMLDFTMMLNKTPCDLCKKKDSYAILCLICGVKVCKTNECSIKTLHKGKTSYEYHSMICGMGSTVYVGLLFGEITFMRQFRLIESNIYIYLNQFGEQPGRYDKCLKDYKLSQIELNKVKHMYITYSGRKSN